MFLKNVVLLCCVTVFCACHPQEDYPGAPEIWVEPENIDLFSENDINEKIITTSIFIYNSGEDPLEIFDITVQGKHRDLRFLDLDEDFLNIIETNDVSSVDINFNMCFIPRESLIVTINSNDPIQPEISIEILGTKDEDFDQEALDQSMVYKGRCQQIRQLQPEESPDKKFYSEFIFYSSDDIFYE